MRLRPPLGPPVLCLAAGVLVLGAIGVSGRLLPQERSDGPASTGDREEAERDKEALRRLQVRSEVDRRVDLALEFLAKQQRSDGGFGRDRKFPTALTSLSVLAFLSRGHVPDDTKYGQIVRRGLDYLLAEGRQDKEGYFGNDNPGSSDRSDMYGHGITTLLLAEVVGMGITEEQDRKIFTSCRRALDLILRAQRVPKKKGFEGGWRYEPRSPLSDLSITVWQVMALRAAANAGVEVPDRAVDDAVDFIRACFDAKEGGFVYLPGRAATVSSVAAGVLSMQVCGRYDATEVRGGADWLVRTPPRWTDAWFYYGVYYYSQAMHQLGESRDQSAKNVVHDLLFARQQADGSWPPPPESEKEAYAGPIYTTAMAVLALSVEYRFLPIYQR